MKSSTEMLSHTDIQKIESRHGSPFYLFDEGAFRKNYDDIVRAFKSRYDKFILAYSYKTNYIPYLCGIVKKKGAFAEVVSRLEYDLALKVGQNPRKIIFNGPVKHYEDIALALRNGSTVNLDSWYELDCVEQYARKNPRRQVRIGVRINIGLSDEGGCSHIQEKLPLGRFGFSPAAASIQGLVSRLAKSGNIVVSSLHGHTSTTDRSVWCYKVITETLCGIAERSWPDTIEYINIGGGIFGYLPPQMQAADAPSFDDYARAVCDILRTSNWARRQNPWLVLEPGVAMAANTLSFITRVMCRKNIHDQVFVTVDGSAFNTKPTFHKINQPYQIIKKTATSECQTYSVVGSTCMEKDHLLTDITDAKVEQGDYVRIDNVGAYTVVLTPPFINPAPPILVKRAKGYKVIRRRQSLRDMFAGYSFD